MPSHKFTIHNQSAGRLTPETVAQIRTLWDAGGVTQGELCRRFGVGVAQIGKIVRREAWVHVKETVTPQMLDAQAEASMQAVQARLAADIDRRVAKDAAGDAMLEELGHLAAEQQADLAQTSLSPSRGLDQGLTEDEELLRQAALERYGMGGEGQ